MEEEQVENAAFVLWKPGRRGDVGLPRESDLHPAGLQSGPSQGPVRAQNQPGEQALLPRLWVPRPVSLGTERLGMFVQASGPGQR